MCVYGWELYTIAGCGFAKMAHISNAMAWEGARIVAEMQKSYVGYIVDLLMFIILAWIVGCWTRCFAYI